MRVAAFALAAVLATAAPAWAATLDEIRNQARATAISPGSGGSGEQAALERLGRLAIDFLDAADRSETGAVAAYEAVETPLAKSYDAHRAAMDRLSRSVIDADGDMDALFDTPEWQTHQQLATQALYYLNWLHYRGALLYSSDKRKALLEEAAEGFGEFATAAGDNPIVIESRLGRGFAYMELDQPDWAIADFESVVKAKGASPERVRKAQLALAEAYIKAKKSGPALAASSQALRDATPDDQARAKIARARALLMAASAADAADKAAKKDEAAALLKDVQAGGGRMASTAGAMLRAGLDNPAVWGDTKTKAGPPPPTEWEFTRGLVASGKYKEAIPRLEAVLASKDEEESKNQLEAQYLLGIVRFKSGDLARAIASLDAVLDAKEKPAYRGDASYLRFKANEALYAANSTAETLPAYEQSIVSFTSEFPTHKSAAEAHYRLGEIRQREERYADAVAEYAQVKGDPAFELRATFGTAQSTVKQLELTPEGQKVDHVLRAQADGALESFWAQVAAVQDPKALGDVPVDELKGQASLMSAYLAALADEPDYAKALSWLDGFEEKYPSLANQEPHVVKLRLAAYSRLGRLREASAESERPAVAELEPAFLDDLATRFLTTAARLQAEGKTDEAAAGRRAALRLTQTALASKDVASLGPVVKRRLQSTLAHLYEEGGEVPKALALYREILASEPDVVSARAGAARILEGEGNTAEARVLWDEVCAAREPGRPGWLEAHYQSARLSVALGERDRACTVLRKVPSQMLANANAETPKKIAEMLRAVCAG